MISIIQCMFVHAVSQATPHNLKRKGVWWPDACTASCSHGIPKQKRKLCTASYMCVCTITKQPVYKISKFWIWMVEHGFQALEQLVHVVTRPFFSWDWGMWFARLVVSTVSCILSSYNIGVVQLLCMCRWWVCAYCTVPSSPSFSEAREPGVSVLHCRGIWLFWMLLSTGCSEAGSPSNPMVA